MEVNGRWIGGEYAFVSVDKVSRDLKTNLAHPGDIIVTQRGTLGQVSIVPDDSHYSRFVISQSQMAISVDHARINRDYLYYYLRSPVFAEYSHTQTIQTGVPHINLGILRDAPLEMRPLTEQRSIARVLGALDDKIELNRRMSATLEEMAWALYRSWFVDFDPVHARALGHPPAHMDATTAALFPDSFGPDSLPKGWEMWSVNDVFEVVMGQSPPGNTYNDDGDGLPFFQGRTDFGFRYPENRKFCSAPSRIAEPESVLLSVRAPVGDLNRAWERCCIGRGVASLSEKAGRTSFGYYAMWSLKAELLSYDSEGTVFGAINKKQLLGLSCVAVPEALRDCFEEIVAPIDSRIRNLTDQSRTLAALRDALLPRLMSGELRIREAQKQVEEAVSA